jgi:ATP-binding protein involved in chromosome partitioning
MDEHEVREALEALRGDDGARLVEAEAMLEVLVEGAWAGVALDKEDASDVWLASVHTQLKRAFPPLAIELRAGKRIYRGGAGFGTGRHVVAVVGGKGGVGKSTLSVNLALTFAAMGRAVGIVDADINAPDIPHLLGVHMTRAPAGFGWRLASSKLVPPSKRNPAQERLGVEVMSVGFVVPERVPPVIGSWMLVSTLLRYLVYEVAWSADMLLIDAPPGTGEEVRAIARDLPLSGAIFVTTPQDLAQMDAERTLTLLAEHDVPVIGVVYNMSSMTCPHCASEIDMFAQSGRLAEQAPVLGRIPFDVELSKAADRGRPLVLGDPQGPIAFEFAKLAAAVGRWLSERNGSAPHQTLEEQA